MKYTYFSKEWTRFRFLKLTLIICSNKIKVFATHMHIRVQTFSYKMCNTLNRIYLRQWGYIIERSISTHFWHTYIPTHRQISENLNEITFITGSVLFCFLSIGIFTFKIVAGEGRALHCSTLSNITLWQLSPWDNLQPVTTSNNKCVLHYIFISIYFVLRFSFCMRNRDHLFVVSSLLADVY